jgi:quinol monooxygenase YgiN
VTFRSDITRDIALSGTHVVVQPGRTVAASSDMPVAVILELKLKPESVPAARDVMGRALQDTRAFAGNLRTDVLVDEDNEAHWLIYELWDTVDHDEAYRAFRAGEGRLTDLPPLLAAPPVKKRYVITDI